MKRIITMTVGIACLAMPTVASAAPDPEAVATERIEDRLEVLTMVTASPVSVASTAANTDASHPGRAGAHLRANSTANTADDQMNSVGNAPVRIDPG